MHTNNNKQGNSSVRDGESLLKETHQLKIGLEKITGKKVDLLPFIKHVEINVTINKGSIIVLKNSMFH